MKRLTKKNRKMSVEAYACICGGEDACAGSCGGNYNALISALSGHASLSTKYYYSRSI